MAKTVQKRSAVKQKIRIRLKAYDHRVIDKSSKTIIDAAINSGAQVVGPVPLPTQLKRWCILKSPHVNKRGGEHYELRIHKRLIYILEPPATAVDALMQLNLPAGVNVEIKLN